VAAEPRAAGRVVLTYRPGSVSDPCANMSGRTTIVVGAGLQPLGER